jgi:hypothetical protein
MTNNSQRIVGIEAERVTNISSVDYPGHYDYDGEFSWDLSAFKKVPLKGAIDFPTTG